MNHISGSARPCRTFQHGDYFRFHSKTCNGCTLRLYYRRQAVRRKFTRIRILYSSNVMVFFNATILTLELSGDVHPLLGPIPAPNQYFPRSTHEARCLRIAQWNVNRLKDTKLDQIRLLLTSSKNIDVNVMFLIETLLKPSKPDSLLAIPGYTLHRKEGAKKGGGIVAFIADRVKASRNYDLEEDCVELMWLNIHPHKSHRPILVDGLYRPPSTDTDTDSKIENDYLRNQETIILGDFNINSLNTSTFNNHRLIKSLMRMHIS